MAKITDISNKREFNSIDLIGSQYSYIFDYLDEGVLIINDRARVIYANPAYTKMFDVSNLAMIKNNIFNKIDDEVITKVLRHRKSIKGKLDHFVDGRQITVSAAPIYSDDRFEGVIAIYRKGHISEIDMRRNIVFNLSEDEDENLIPPLNSHFQKIITQDWKMKKVLSMAQRASKVSSSVLIRGDSGTGKELVARAIHNSSPRRNKAFIAVNCATIPENLLESELFGHEQGSFTGAIKRKIGKFEEADGGTIFLDEIGDMPLDMQVKLLRVLQEGEFQRVGGNDLIKSDVRILSATHRNLEKMIEEGKFRQDLYYRINVINVELPSLKERNNDIELLCDHFIDKINKKLDTNIKGLAEEVIEVFYEHDWPGNVRELENVMERLMVLAEDEIIQLKEVPSHISKLYKFRRNFNKGDNLINTDQNGEIYKLEEYERDYKIST